MMIGALLGLSHAMVEDLSPTCPACHHHSYLIAQLNSFAFLICNSCQQASTKDLIMVVRHVTIKESLFLMKYVNFVDV